VHWYIGGGGGGGGYFGGGGGAGPLNGPEYEGAGGGGGGGSSLVPPGGQEEIAEEEPQVQISYTVPAVTKVSPTKGPPSGGTSVTITGTDLTGATAVKFGSRSATSFTVNSPTSITAVSPPWTAGNAIAEVTVTTSNGTSRLTVEDSFIYEPKITTLAPRTGPVSGGTLVKITGVAFEGHYENGAGEMLPFVSEVKFGTASAESFVVNSGTQITAVSPSESAGLVNLIVTTLGGTSPVSAAEHYKFYPTITGLNPTGGSKAGGTTVTVTGTGFALGSGATLIKFGTKKATSVNCTSTTTCTVVSPPHEVGKVDVRATVNKVISPKTAADQFTYF
jgi:hypothetical protein